MNAKYDIKPIKNRIAALNLIVKLSPNKIEVKELKMEIVNLRSQLNIIKYMQLTR